MKYKNFDKDIFCLKGNNIFGLSVDDLNKIGRWYVSFFDKGNKIYSEKDIYKGTCIISNMLLAMGDFTSNLLVSSVSFLDKNNVCFITKDLSGTNVLVRFRYFNSKISSVEVIYDDRVNLGYISLNKRVYFSSLVYGDCYVSKYYSMLYNDAFNRKDSCNILKMKLNK